MDVPAIAGDLLVASPDRLLLDRVAAGRDARGHAHHDALGEQVGQRKRLVGLRDSPRSGRPSRATLRPRAAHREPPAAQGDGAGLAAVPCRAAVLVVASLGPGQLGDLGLHQLGHHL